MTALALALVLSAAVLHASWNALVKAVPDRAVVLAAVSSMNSIAGIVLLFFAPAPSQASWFYLLLSTVLHFAYYAFLFQSYRFGDLSQVYPISRGLAPVLVALGAYLTIGEQLPFKAWISLAAVSAGIMLLAFQRRGAGTDPRAVAAAGVTGLLIAGYSVTDGIGVRLSGHPLGYMAWVFLLEFPIVLFIYGRRRAQRGPFPARSFAIGLVAGIGAVLAYGLVLYAKSIAPLGAVSAVRESSVIIATLIGVVFFHERPWRPRLASAVIVGAGVIALAVYA